jgi:homoserine O-succinyltransferase/O-acetyltransferase
MPVALTLPSSDTDRSRCNSVCTNPSAKCIERRSKTLNIGLLNNMPDGALESTERQFRTLLNLASDEFTICLSFYSLPEIPRSASTQNHIDRHYRSTESLCNTELDGLIVTGKEPNAASLSDEPFWHSFVKVLEWTRENTCSTIWSCLAAHAAVLHMDGIQRVRSNRKHSGIFDCTRTAEHRIAAGLPARFRLPHSRWNDLPEHDLVRLGYQLLIQSDRAGVDCFIKQEHSLFLFFQSHPEYELETLLLEYRRDVARYLKGEIGAYPDVPQGFFDRYTLDKLLEVQREAITRSHEETFARLGLLLSTVGVEGGWHETAMILYKNWLQYISSEKRMRLEKRHTGARMRPDALQPALLGPAALIAG